MAVPIILLEHGHRKSHAAEEEEDDHAQAFKGIPKPLRPYFQQAQEKELPIIQKFNTLAFEDIELEEVEDLIATLAPEPELCEKIPLSRVRHFICSPLLEDPLDAEESDMLLNALAQEGKEEIDVFVSRQELLITLRTSPGAEEFVAARKARYKKDGGDTGYELTRTNMVKRIEEVTNRHDAFLTLPITVIYTLLFVLLVQGHLRIFDRQVMERAMEEFVNGRDPRETADENVDDIDSWWEWVQGPGTGGPFGKIAQSKNNFTTCQLSSRNYLLGDVRIRYIKFDGATEKEWLLSSTVGETARTGGASFLDASREAAQYFQDNGWLDPEIEWLYLEFNTYNEFHRMFGMTEVKLPLRKSGEARTRINTDAVCIEAYKDGEYTVLVMDILYVSLVGFIFLSEFKEMCLALKGGLGELLDYLEFWNIVDWFNIFMSGAIVALWFLMMSAMKQEALTSILDLDYRLSKDIMMLSAEELEGIDEALVYLRQLYIGTHSCMAILTASVVLKFFKAFQANLRLRVVTDTFKAALVDLCHFFITFSTIYLPFTLIGHIMFGSDIIQFSSIVASLNTGFICLMGDFGWYVEVTEGMLLAETLPSGIPKLLVMLWFFAYMFLMFLVLLNMLLAVIMDAYMKVTEKHATEFERPTLWAQARQYLAFRKQTKKYVSLEHMRRGLEDDDHPAHSQEDVTQDSLKDTWPEMSQEQIEWLLDWLQKWLDAKAENSQDAEEKTLSLSEENRELALSNREKILNLTNVVMKNKGRIDRIIDSAEQKMGKTQAPAEPVYDRTELDSVSTTVKDLVTVISKVRRDQERLARRVEELTLAIPQDAKVAKTNMAPNSAAKPARLSGTKKVSSDSKEKKEKKEKKDKKLDSSVRSVPAGGGPGKAGLPSTRSEPGRK